MALDTNDARLLDTILGRGVERALASPGFALRLLDKPDAAAALAQAVADADGERRDTAFALLTRFSPDAIEPVLDAAQTARAARAAALLDVVWGILCDRGRLERESALSAAAVPLRRLLVDRRPVERELAPETEADVELRVCDETYLLVSRLGPGHRDESVFRMADPDERDIQVARLASRLGRAVA